MTNRQLDMENIDRVDNLVYTPLEKRYLKARIAGTVLAYAGLMVLPLFILLADDLKGRGTILLCTESLLAVIAAVNLMLIPKACAFMGFALREHDITWRTGIIFCTYRERCADDGGYCHPRTGPGEGGRGEGTSDRKGEV